MRRRRGDTPSVLNRRLILLEFLDADVSPLHSERTGFFPDAVHL
jgi:hypothetical protein